MGMFDEVRIEFEVPGLPGLPRNFQTKSLDSCMDGYTITKAGRLVRSSRGFSLWADEESSGSALAEPEVDIDFHGDMRLRTSEGEYQEFVARFTHGNLEWLRPIAEVPKELLSRLY